MSICLQDKGIVIVGANSAIAFEVARLLAERGARLFLLGRDPAKLERNAADLRVRSERAVEWTCFEAGDTESHPELWLRATQALGSVDGLLVAHGAMGVQESCQTDFDQQREIFETNFVGAASFLTLAAETMIDQGHGFIAAISSPAGDRGRAKNYVYGAAKGALTIYLEGLRQRLHRHGVRVLTIKPGFVRTPMTEGQKLPLLAAAEAVAADIVRALETEREEIYTPAFWRPIMVAVKAIPGVIFKRLSF